LKKIVLTVFFESLLGTPVVLFMSRCYFPN